MEYKLDHPKPKACPLNAEMFLDLLQGKALTIQGICEYFYGTWPIHPDDFTGNGPNDLEGFLNRGLPHQLVEVEGQETYALIRPVDFRAFMNSTVNTAKNGCQRQPGIATAQRMSI